MNNNYNNNALTPREIGMMIVFVLAVAAVLTIAIKGMREESKKSKYEIQGADVKKSNNAKWIPLSIIGVGIVMTIVVVAISSRSNKRMKN